jgi:hypothetical protein
MNILIIILGLMLVVLLYFVYTIMTAVPVVVKKVELTKPAPNISPTTINNPYSLNYSVGVWIYVAQFSPQIGRFLMFGDKTYYGSQSLFSLRMDTAGNNLYADILVNKAGPSVVPSNTPTMDASTTPSSTPVSGNMSTPTILPVLLNVTQDAFPIQKWVYVVVSVSSNFVEAYINGKFVTAVNINNNTTYGINGVYQALAPKDPNSGATFSFGGQGSTMDDGTIRQNGCQVVLSQLSRWDTPLSSGDVYNNYLKGNGESTSIWGPSYHFNISLSQNQNTYTLPVF